MFWTANLLICSISALLNRGADPHSKDEQGKTAIEYAKSLGVEEWLYQKDPYPCTLADSPVSMVPDHSKTGSEFLNANMKSIILGFDLFL